MVVLYYDMLKGRKRSGHQRVYPLCVSTVLWGVRALPEKKEE